MPWREFCGLTEAGILTAMSMEPAEAMVGKGSNKPPCPDVDLRIADDQGRDVPSGHEGEIVADAAVMPEPDDVRGEEDRAFLQPAGDADGLTESAVIDFCLSQLAKHKIPRYIQFRDEFPRTLTFGPIKSELARPAAEHGVALCDRVDSRGS